VFNENQKLTGVISTPSLTVSFTFQGIAYLVSKSQMNAEETDTAVPAALSGKVWSYNDCC
jgi:hypothetical protein